MLAGSLRGGLGVGIILVGVLMGATTGIVGATVVTLGLLTLPGMLRRGYDKGLACGTICASGTLGQIIPPSLILILLADIMNLSVGTLFAAAMIPGLMLAGIYCRLHPGARRRAPGHGAGHPQGGARAGLAQAACRQAAAGRAAAGRAGRRGAGLDHRRRRRAVRGRVDGALGSIVITAIDRRLSWKVLRETAQATTKITAMMMFILICAQVFALAFRGLQGERLVQDFFEFLPGGIWADIWFLMLIIFILGFFIEWIEISYIAVPLFLPVFIAANVDMVWLATLICVNLQTSFLTPPFGWALFFLRGVAPPEVKTGDIYRGIIPFVGHAARRAGAGLLLPGARDLAAQGDRLVIDRRCALRPPLVLVGIPQRAFQRGRNRSRQRVGAFGLARLSFAALIGLRERERQARRRAVVDDARRDAFDPQDRLLIG